MPELKDLVVCDVVSSFRKTSAAGTVSETRNRPCWALILKQEGRTVYHVDGREYYSDALHPVILPQGSDYTWRCLESGEYLAIHFVCDREEKGIYTFEIADNRPIQRAFLTIERNSALHRRTARLANVKALYEVLIELIEAQRTDYVPSSQYDLLRPAVEYMAEHYSDPSITNETLARRCGVSTVYFRKTFSRVFRVPPMRYLQNLRMDKAREMLCGDYGSISEIAESTGYNSLYHFSKMFKASTGVSPLAYHLRQTRGSDK